MPRLLPGFIAAAALLLGGCQQAAVVESAPAPAPAPAPVAVVIDADRYDLVFDAAVDQLRAWQFVVDRQDRRFGVVTARPAMAATVIEPWKPDATRSDRTLAATVNAERRRVQVRILPPGEAADDTADADAAAPSTYRLQVVAAVDRRHLPPQQLHTAAVGRARINMSSSRFRSLETERGVLKPFWEPVGRDAQFERHLADAILERAATMTAQATAATIGGPGS